MISNKTKLISNILHKYISQASFVSVRDYTELAEKIEIEINNYDEEKNKD